MRTVSSIFLVLFLLNSLISQNLYDAQWVIGYDTSTLTYGGDAILMDFRNGELDISNINTVDDFAMEGSNTSMCDKDGNLLFYSNGCYIVNAAHEIMENGTEINLGVIEDYFCPTGGSPLSQGIIALPQPNNASRYYLFNPDIQSSVFESPDNSLAPLNLYYHIIDMTQENGLGAVIAKNQIAVQDTLGRGMITATQHANGTDWWLIMPESHSNCYYLTLLTENGVQAPIKKCTGFYWDDNDGGQAKFSPDGRKYIRFNYQNGLHILDFDTNNGNFSNPIDIQFPNDTFPANSGVSISPNSRFLYASARKNLYQFDLEAENIEESRVLVAEWDGFANPYPTIFHSSALGPDGKIYIASTSSHLNLHVIHKPNCKGLDCEVEQHGIDLPTWNFASIPNLPYYKKDEIYECDTTIDIEETTTKLDIKISPNPTFNSVYILQGDKPINGLEIKIFDVQGQLRINQILSNNREEINLNKLEEGIYVFQISKNNKIINVNKVIKVTR